MKESNYSKTGVATGTTASAQASSIMQIGAVFVKFINFQQAMPVKNKQKKHFF
jgi:hypothetical protein